MSSKRTIEEDLGDQDNCIQALITGSLHLVSGALCLLEPDDPFHKIHVRYHL